MKNKSDFSYLIPQFYTTIETQLGAKIKIFRLNNAKELKFIDYFSKTGTLHQFSCVECPRQNSVVERKHQYLLIVAWALYFQSRVPLKFCSEYILIATYLINRMPTPLLENRSPYEMLYGLQVDYSMPRVFGCLAFASTLHAYRTKFQPRAQAYVFLDTPLESRDI